MSTTLKQKLTLPLIILLLIIAAVITGYFLIDKMLSQPPKIKNIKIDTNAALKLNVLKQISKKNGIKEWELQAASATLLKDEDKAVLENVSVIFYTKDNKKVHLTAKTGELNTKTHDMLFSTDVIVTYEDAVLRTDRLQYYKKEHIIQADSRVTIEKQKSAIEADSMVTRLNKSTVILKGHVKGQFSENINMQ